MNKQSKVLKWCLITGIVIVLNLFFNYALSLAYKQPVYDDFCPAQKVRDVITTEQACVGKGGQWNGYDSLSVAPQRIGETIPTGYCDQQFDCRNDFEAARKIYDKNVFITLVLLGALCVAGGSFLKKNMLLGVALSLAGVLSFVVASTRYWGSADDLIKVIILAIALALLVWVAVKKFKDN